MKMQIVISKPIFSTFFQCPMSTMVSYILDHVLHVTKNTKSGSSFQLRKRDLKTEKYGQFSIINKCLSDWNQLHKHLRTNFKDIKHSELKTIVTNHLPK